MVGGDWEVTLGRIFRSVALDSQKVGGTEKKTDNKKDELANHSRVWNFPSEGNL